MKKEYINRLFDTEKTGDCAFLMVVTKDSLAYQREDGVYVIPLGCLKN
ncbi:hypothetical protein IKQ02_05065 [bacterium]|nr:hypothetical protein [bacterium]